jgi:hypothetical protein
VAELSVAGRVFRARVLDPFARFDLAASAWVTPSLSGPNPLRGGEEFCEGWPSAGLASDGRAYALVGSGHSARQGSAGRWPTPNAKISNFGERPLSWLKRRERLKKNKYNGNGAGMPLAIAVQIGQAWPAATLESIAPSAQGRLNPAWVEWLMGFPIGWTECRSAGRQRGRAA